MLKGPVSRAEVVGDRLEKMSATLLTCSQHWVYRLRALNHFQKKRLTPMWGNKREKRTTSNRKRKIAMQRWDSFKDACARRVWKGVGSAVRKTYSYPICWREDRTYFCQSQKHNYFSRPKVENKHGLEGVARQKWSWSMVHFLDVLNRVKLYINISQLHMFIWTVIGKTNINSYWEIQTLQMN